MKRTLFNITRTITSLVVLLMTLPVWGNDGDTFTEKTVEGVNLTYTIISEAEKTCMVGEKYNWPIPTARANRVHRVSGSHLSGDITIPEVANGYAVVRIEAYAFEQAAITSVVIPNSVKAVGIGAFNGCADLESVRLSNKLSKIEGETFFNCTNLTSIDIPEGVTSIGDEAFAECISLESIVIPNSVTSIGVYAFALCKNLTSLSIGSGVKEILWAAFLECTKLSDVFYYAEEVPYTAQLTFDKSTIGVATLHVPAASLQVYKETAPWSDFKNIVPLETPMAYRPFVEDGKVWKVGSTTGISDSIVKMVEYYYFDGDTIIDGKTFKQMMCQRYVNHNHPDYAIIVKYPLLRKVGAWYEEDKKVYFYNATSKQFRMMYDFSLNANDTLLIDNYYPYVIGPKQTGGLEGFKGIYRDVMWCTDRDPFYCTTWLEGVGGIDGPTVHIYFGEENHGLFLMSCTVGDEVIYFNGEYEDGATPEEVVGARKDRIDFTHTIKIKPKSRTAREAEAKSLYGEYNSQQLGINLNALDEAYQVSITDEAGKAVYEKTVNAGNIVGLNIDISAYAKGRYTVTVENSMESFTGQFETLATGIEENVRIEKFKNGSIYNLQGQRISTPRKGLNIVYGRKVYVK